jgi:nucleoside-diphosphate-sugar epimerase
VKKRSEFEVSEIRRCAIIFGGSGFIGLHLAEELESCDYEVVIADLIPPNSGVFKFLSCDVRNPIDIKLDSPPDIVFNLAAVHRTPGHSPAEYYETNVKGALNVTRWATENCVKKILFTSSISVYGPNENLIDENATPSPINDYGKSKLIAEDIHRDWQSADSHNRSVLICRPAVVFGSGENGNFTRLARALKGHYFFYPSGRETRKASGYVKDATRSFMFFAERNLPEITYNFCFPRNYTIGEICDVFCRLGNYSKPPSLRIARFAKFLSKLHGPLGILGQRLIKLVLSTNVMPARLIEYGFNWNYDLNIALDDWYKQTKFDQYLN